ncbi:PUB49 [Symbiodinium natans]|uniref:PUB49 protein n=1 Tax=Symbiodinium natans TaxID=878477 RepID=A0A812H596_9DINO|nr:PUB49 [Symbiodinium natans]
MRNGYSRVPTTAGTAGPPKHPEKPTWVLRTQFLRHSFLVWVVLPLCVYSWDVLAPSRFKASCSQGYSLTSLFPLCLVELHYLYAESCAWSAMKALLSQPELVILKQFGVLQYRKWLVLLGLCEGFLLFTDVSFPFVARACDEILTEDWGRAWGDVPMIGQLMASLVAAVRFWGFALLATVAVILTNGVAGLLLCIPFSPDGQTGQTGQTTGAEFVAWARAAETAMMPSVAFLAEEMANQKRHLTDYSEARSDEGAGSFGNKLDPDAAVMFENFNRNLAAHIHFSESAHFMLLMLGKILLGRCLQLWIQSSFLALAFHQEAAGAKDKVILGCCLGAVLLLHRALHSMKMLGCMGLPLLVLIIACVTWAGAKIALAFVCKDHLWNLTTGCVKLSQH